MRTKLEIVLGSGSLVCMLVAAGSAAPQRVLKGNEPPFPPTSGTAKIVLTLPPSAIENSLEELCGSSSLIVDGFVQSTLTPWINGKSLETDVILLIRSVLKGNLTGQQLLVSQPGGVLGQFKEDSPQYSLMQPGEHYILFLERDNRTGVPVREGLPRYHIMGSFIGSFRIEAEKVHLNPGTGDSLRRKYDGADLQETLGEINGCL